MAEGTVPYFAYGAVELTGNTRSSLDAIPGKGLHHNDIAVALQDNKIYFFKLDAYSGETHNPPYVIKPHNYTGEKRWVLISQEFYTTDIIQQAENFIQTGYIKALPSSDIQIETPKGEKICIKQNGVVEFPSYVSSSPSPSGDNDLTNKLYVDTEFDNKESSLQTKIDNDLDTVYNDLKTYIDDEYDTKSTELSGQIDTQFDDKESNIISYVDNKESNVVDYVDTRTQVVTANMEDYVDSVTEELSASIDRTVSTTENKLKKYSDEEVDRVVNDVYPIKRHEILEDDWTQDQDLYYYNIVHNKGFYQLVIRCWDIDNQSFSPQSLVALDENTTRIWMPEKIYTIVNVL